MSVQDKMPEPRLEDSDHVYEDIDDSELMLLRRTCSDTHLISKVHEPEAGFYRCHDNLEDISERDLIPDLKRSRSAKNSKNRLSLDSGQGGSIMGDNEDKVEPEPVYTNLVCRSPSPPPLPPRLKTATPLTRTASSPPPPPLPPPQASVLRAPNLPAPPSLLMDFSELFASDEKLVDSSMILPVHHNNNNSTMNEQSEETRSTSRRPRRRSSLFRNPLSRRKSRDRQQDRPQMSKSDKKTRRTLFNMSSPFFARSHDKKSRSDSPTTGHEEEPPKKINFELDREELAAALRDGLPIIPFIWTPHHHSKLRQPSSPSTSSSSPSKCLLLCPTSQASRAVRALATPAASRKTSGLAQLPRGLFLDEEENMEFPSLIPSSSCHVHCKSCTCNRIATTHLPLSHLLTNDANDEGDYVKMTPRKPLSLRK